MVKCLLNIILQNNTCVTISLIFFLTIFLIKSHFKKVTFSWQNERCMHTNMIMSMKIDIEIFLQTNHCEKRNEEFFMHTSSKKDT